MALRFADRTKETSTAQSSSTITLSGTAPTGFQSFNSGVGDGNSGLYVVTDGTNWEVNCGVYTHSAKTLARPSAPIASSNSGAQVSSFTGTVSVFLADSAAHVTAMDWGIASGRLYSNAFIEGRSLGTNGAGLNQLHFSPVWIREPFNTVKLHFNVATVSANAGAVASLGLYANDAGPSVLLGSQTGLDVGSVGGVTGDNATSPISMPRTQMPGLYWVGYLSSVAAATLGAVSSGTTPASKTVFGITSTTDTGSVSGFLLTSQFSLPNPATGYSAEANTTPFVGVEVSL